MSAPDITGETLRPDENIPEGLAVVGFYRTTQEGFDHSLVIFAVGYPCWLVPAGTGYQLLVETSALSQVRTELMKYERESIGWPPEVASEKPAMERWDFVTPLIWALGVVTVFRGQWRHPEWSEAGMLNAVKIFEHGEVWRLFTALFLHQNAVHLVSNLCGGIYFFAAVLSVFGRARGWLLLALGATTGNLAAAAINYPGDYRSMGASTALFAGLGLLTGRAVRNAACASHPNRWRLLFVPFASGLVMLGLYGAGGPGIDVAAHFTGFMSGLVLGFTLGRSESLDA